MPNPDGTPTAAELTVAAAAHARQMSPEQEILNSQMQTVVLNGVREFGAAQFDACMGRLKDSMSPDQWNATRRNAAGRPDAHKQLMAAAESVRPGAKYGKGEAGVPDALWSSGFSDSLTDKEFYAEVDRRWSARHPTRR